MFKGSQQDTFLLLSNLSFHIPYKVKTKLIKNVTITCKLCILQPSLVRLQNTLALYMDNNRMYYTFFQRYCYMYMNFCNCIQNLLFIIPHCGCSARFAHTTFKCIMYLFFSFRGSWKQLIITTVSSIPDIFIKFFSCFLGLASSTGYSSWAWQRKPNVFCRYD